MMTGFERYTKKTRGRCCGSGAGGAVDRVVGLDPAVHPKPGNGTTAERTGADAADSFSAAVVQPVDPPKADSKRRPPVMAGLKRRILRRWGGR